MGPLVTWLVTGFLVGWLVRIVMGSRRQLGVLGDFTLGLLGALIGGWLFKYLGVTTPGSNLGQVFVAVVGAASLVGGLRLLRRLVQAGMTTLPGTITKPFDVDLYGQLNMLNEFERRVLGHVLGRKPTIEDPNRTFDAQLTFGERVADRVATFGGSWAFIGLFFTALIVWMIVNNESQQPFDPYPFILLNLILSCLAALQAPVIMMSQNRMAAKDRLDAQSDYQVNLRAEMEIMSLHGKLDAVRESEWSEFLRLQQDQLDALRRIEHRLLSSTESGNAR